LLQWHTEKNSCVLPDLICERCGRFSSAFESVMGADLLLNVRSLLDETSDQWWYPHTLIYSASRVLPLLVRAEQSDQFRTLTHLLGGGNKQELVSDGCSVWMASADSAGVDARTCAATPAIPATTSMADTQNMQSSRKTSLTSCPKA
jgi:hypothetical protein